jgi:hypothetical protein
MKFCLYFLHFFPGSNKIQYTVGVQKNVLSVYMFHENRSSEAIFYLKA